MKNIRLIHFIVLKEKNFDNTTFVKHCIIIVISWQITCSIPKKDLFLYWTLTHFVLLFSTKPRVFAY